MEEITPLDAALNSQLSLDVIPLALRRQLKAIGPWNTEPLEKLSHYPFEVAGPIFEALSKHPHWDIRMQVVNALDEYPRAYSGKLLLKIGETDKDRGVRMRAGEVLLAHRHDLTNGKNGIAATALGIIDNAWKRDNEQKLRTAFPRENAEISRELVKAALKPSEKQVKSANYGARTASARVAAAP